jgi:hypothetical protein
MEIGRKCFLADKVTPSPQFINSVNEIDNIDIIYLASVLQYIKDYRQLLLSLI